MKKFLLTFTLTLLLSTQVTWAYPLQIKVHDKAVNLDIFTENGTPYFSVSGVCEYLNFSSSFKNGVLTISSYDGRSKILDSYISGNGLLMIDSRAYISGQVLQEIGCTVNYYEAANVYSIDYIPQPSYVSSNFQQEESQVTLLHKIFETDLTKVDTKTLLIQTFQNILQNSSTLSQQELRLAVQNYIEYLQGATTDYNTVVSYKLALINTSQEEEYINFLPFDIKWYIWHSQEYVEVDDTLSNEQSIENIINGEKIITNSRLLQVARLEATARNVTNQADIYRRMRDYVYLKIR